MYCLGPPHVRDKVLLDRVQHVGLRFVKNKYRADSSVIEILMPDQITGKLTMIDND